MATHALASKLGFDAIEAQPGNFTMARSCGRAMAQHDVAEERAQVIAAGGAL